MHQVGFYYTDVPSIITVVLRELWRDVVDWIHVVQYTYQLLRTQ